MARVKLQRWADAIADCQACLALAPGSMKALFQMAQAQLELGDDPDAALENAARAHEAAARDGDRSLAATTQLVLRCKKARWDRRERARLRQRSELEGEVLALLVRERDRAVAECEGGEAERRDVEAEWDAKLAAMRDTFRLAGGEQARRREVPDWAIDDITFGIMVDPVVTKTGKSYERASLLEHLRRSKTDPVTRDHLDVSDLRPNLDLRDACAEFLEENGWAVDW